MSRGTALEKQKHVPVEHNTVIDEEEEAQILLSDDSEEEESYFNNMSKAHKVQVVSFETSGNLLWFDYPAFLDKSRSTAFALSERPLEQEDDLQLIEREGEGESLGRGMEATSELKRDTEKEEEDQEDAAYVKPMWMYPSAPLTWTCKWNRFPLDAVLERAGLIKVQYDDKLLKNKTCSLIWSKHPKNNAKLFFQLRPHQRFNHIPGSRNITRKDTLIHTLQQMTKISKTIKPAVTKPTKGKNKKTKHKPSKSIKVSKAYNFFPESYRLPGQLKEFRKALGLKADAENSSNHALKLEGLNIRDKRASIVAYNNRTSMKRKGSNSPMMSAPGESEAKDTASSQKDEAKEKEKEKGKGKESKGLSLRRSFQRKSVDRGRAGGGREDAEGETEYWISKPAAGSKGSGIRIYSQDEVFDKVKRNIKKTVIQRYVHQPYLIEGKKFDIRLYVVITSFNPLKIYFFPEGLVRFCTENYSIQPNLLSGANFTLSRKNSKTRASADESKEHEATGEESGENRKHQKLASKTGSPTSYSSFGNSYTFNKNLRQKLMAHLTNYSLNSKSLNYVKSDEANKGSKWSFTALQEYLTNKHGEKVVAKLMKNIKDVIIKTCIACTKKANKDEFNLGARFKDKSDLCFELLGFDILLDKALKPWLLECNLSPSLTCNSILDRDVKTTLVCDLLYMVGIPYKAGNTRKQYQNERHHDDFELFYGMDEDVENSRLGKAGGSSNGGGGGVPSGFGNLKDGWKSLKKTVSLKMEQNRQRSYTNKSTGSLSLKKSLFNLKTVGVGVGGDKDFTFSELIEEEKMMIKLSCEEYSRKGHFERLFPPVRNKKLQNYYLQLFSSQDVYLNCLLKDFENEAYQELFEADMPVN